MMPLAVGQMVIDGVPLLMVMLTKKFVEPLLFVAVNWMLYIPAVVGVPVMAPVE